VGQDRERPTSEEDSAFARAPDPQRVQSRADARPPEERTSDDPEAQAEAVLEESEERVAEGSTKSRAEEPP
jgi:hypothetical protein